jgi:hypothetical protein
MVSIGQLAMTTISAKGKNMLKLQSQFADFFWRHMPLTYVGGVIVVCVTSGIAFVVMAKAGWLP